MPNQESTSERRDLARFTGPPVVFVGPTLPAADARAILPGAVVLPPARCGDIVSVLRLAPSAIVLVDGFYDTTPAPWHKEVLWALEAGVPVVGAASMGALRAAELAPFGMIGVGDVYDSYHSGTRRADADVALLQVSGPVDNVAVTDTLVDIEAEVAALVEAGELDGNGRWAVLDAAAGMHFSVRTLDRALTAAGQPPAAVERMSAWVRAQPGGRWPKRRDAEAALRRVASGIDRPTPPEPLSRTVHILRLVAEATLRPLGRPDPALPIAEQLLAGDDALARAAGVVGGLVRAADTSEHGDRASPVGDVLAAARQILLTELADHPAAVSCAARLDRVGIGSANEQLGASLGQLAGPAATPALCEVMAALADGAAVRRALTADPSDDAVAAADAVLPPPVRHGDPLDAARAAGDRRRAAQLFDVIRLGGVITSQLADRADPFDAPSLAGLAILRAVR